LIFSARRKSADLILLAGEQIGDAVVRPGHEADRTLLPEGWLAVSAAPHGVDCERRSLGPEIEYLGERPVAEAQELGAHEFEALRLKIRKLHRRSDGLRKLESHEIEIALAFQADLDAGAGKKRPERAALAPARSSARSALAQPSEPE
jgi:hypothetical protein